MSSFVENVAKLVSGSIVAQGIVVVSTPIVTRLYLPDVFGVAALFTAVTGIISTLSCLRYEQAIMLPQEDGNAAHLLWLSFCLLSLVAAVVALFLYFGGDWLASFLSFSEFENYFWLLPISIFASGIFLPLKHWSSRFKHFGSISIAQVAAALAAQGSKLAAGFAGYGSSAALIISYILGLLVAPIVIGVQIWKRHQSIIHSNFHWKSMVADLKRYKDFPVYSTWSTLLNSASTHLPTILLAFYFSPVIVGYYALGKAVLKIPISLVGGGVAHVFYQKATEVHNQSEPLKTVVAKVFNRLISIGLFPVCMLVLIGKDAFSIAFGEQWAQAGVYAQILAIWIFFQFIASPITTLFFVLEKQGVGLTFNMLLFGTRVASLIGGGMTGDIIFTLYLFTLTGVVCYGLLCVYLVSRVGIRIKATLYVVSKHLLACSPFILMIVLAKMVWGIQAIGVLLMAGLFMVVYYLLVLIQDRELRKHAWALIGRLTST